MARNLLVLIALGTGACGHATSGADAGPSPAPTLPVTTGRYPAFGHAPDFAWIAGRLIRSSPAGQCTYVIFSTGRGQPWGGRIALESSAQEIERFPDGDMVVVNGALDSGALSVCGEPVMTVKSIEEH